MHSAVLDAFNRELSAADPELVGNADVLRGVLAGCGDCIKILDLDGRLQFMSEGGKRVMEVDDFDRLKGCIWPDFWAGENNRSAIEAIAAAKLGKSSRFRGPADTVKGNSRHWDVAVSPIFGSDGQPSHVLSISRDITDEWQAGQKLEAAAQRERFLTEELEHRVKNAFSLVVSMARQTFRGPSFRDALTIFSARIVALAAAYARLSREGWRHTWVHEVTDSTIEPYRSREKDFTVSGPATMLTPAQATTLALALNELATNAKKYGALSTDAGSVAIVWGTSADGVSFEFSWQESG